MTEYKKIIKDQRLALAADAGKIAEHFGHCEAFLLVDIEGGAVSKQELVANPGHKPGFLPNFLADRGVQLIIVGGIGSGAVDIFKERKVEVLTGTQGELEEVLQAYINGSLAAGQEVCREHNHD